MAVGGGICLRAVAENMKTKILILLTLSLLVAFPVISAAQRRSAEPSASRKAKNKDGDTEADIKEKENSALTRLHVLGNRVVALDDVKTRVLTLASFANIAWKVDQPFAKELFSESLDVLARKNDSRLTPAEVSNLRRKILSIIKATDVSFAQQLIGAANIPDSNSSFDAAYRLVREDPESADRLANLSLQDGVSPAMPVFLRQLRLKDQKKADALFLRSLDQLLSSPSVDANLLLLFGTYVFTSPKLEPTNVESVVNTRVGNFPFGVPEITVERPGISTSLVQAYLRVASISLMRPVSEPRQKQLYYVTAYLLMPMMGKYLPEFVPQLRIAMTGLSSDIPPELTQTSTYANINKTGYADPEDAIREIEQLAGDERRDIRYLDLVFGLWRKGDFADARRVTNKISNLKVRAKLETLIDFGSAATSFLDASSEPSSVEEITRKMPHGAERAILCLGVAQAYIAKKNTARANEAINDSLKSTSALDDPRRPLLTLAAASQLAGTDPDSAVSVLATSVKEFNKYSVAKVELGEEVVIGPLTIRFPLRLNSVQFDFSKSLAPLMKMSPQLVESQLRDLKSDELKAEVLLAEARLLSTKLLQLKSRSKD